MSTTTMPTTESHASLNDNEAHSPLHPNGGVSHATTPTTNTTTNHTTTNPTGPTMARRVGMDCLEDCGARLRRGDLVAFPTETVYGLGGHALDETACRKIFAAKERPFTDPLIVHVLEPTMAYPLWAATATTNSSATTQNDKNNRPMERAILHCLCDHFWPGPLTMVAQAAAHTVPDIIMAGTGFVACRSPNHDVARALLRAAQVPIAAPSANKFGHVSPTTAQHVWDDLQHEATVWILEQQEQQQQGDAAAVTTTTTAMDTKTVQQDPLPDVVGVESSVVKLEILSPPPVLEEEPNNIRARLTVLRQGAVSAQQIKHCLQQHQEHYKLDMSCIEVLAATKSSRTSSSNNNNTVADDEPSFSPGQTIRHYSPHVPSFLVSAKCISSSSSSIRIPQSSDAAVVVDPKEEEEDQRLRSLLRDTVIVDYGQRLQRWKEYGLEYRDLSVTNQSKEAAQNVYQTLRWAELVPGAVRILFPDIESIPAPSTTTTTTTTTRDEIEEDALALAVKDRLTRAASGKVIQQLEEAHV